MNIQNTDSYEYRKLIGQIKFSFIAPVVSRTFIDDSISAYFKRVSETEIDWPDGTKRRFSDQTMKWWLHVYRKYGFEGLMPKDRLDFGRVRKLDDDHKRYIADLIGQYPKITGVMIYEKMIEDGVLNTGDCSVDTIQRYIRNSGLRNGQGETLVKERRTWEFAHSCDGYEADTCHTFYIYDEDSTYRKTYLIAIIDNHSRMIVGAEFFFNDNAVNFQKVWHDAVLRYGKSKVIILDNGSSYKNKSTKEIEAKLGTKIIYNPPYQPVGKALIERFFHTMKMRFMDVHKGSDYHSLSQLNDELKRLTSENKMEVIIAIDEAQFLRKEVLREFIMLMNFDYDSKDYCTLIFVGQNEFLRTLRLKALEPLRQRINMNYTFTGFNEEEVKDYVVSRLKSVNCRSDLFKDECYHTLYSMMNTSVRILNQLINKSLILGMHYNKETIDSELVMQASKELMLG